MAKYHRLTAGMTWEWQPGALARRLSAVPRNIESFLGGSRDYTAKEIAAFVGCTPRRVTSAARRAGFFQKRYAPEQVRQLLPSVYAGLGRSKGK